MALVDLADPLSDTLVSARAVVLVEGESDRAALETIAARRGRDLEAERVVVISMDGATNLPRFLSRLGPPGLGLRLAGLCDEGEEAGFRRDLERAGVGSDLTRAGMERLGFFVCVADLEDALIRALGTDEVERIFEAEGDLPSFRRFQRQPAQRERSTHQQLHRSIGAWSERKERYGALLAAAVPSIGCRRRSTGCSRRSDTDPPGLRRLEPAPVAL